MPPKTAATPFNPFAPLSTIRMLWKGKILILVLWAAVTAGVFAFVRRLPATYSAEATIVVNSQKIPERYVSSTVNTDLQDRLASISQLILSSTQLLKIIDDFGLYREDRRQLAPEEIIERMRKAITIVAETKAFSASRVGAFKVGFQGTDPTVVAAVANRISNLYVEENLRTREVEAQGTEEFIDAQLEQGKKSLDTLEAAVSKYKVEHNGELPQQQGELSATLSRLQVALEANRDAINRAQQNKVTLQNSMDMAEASAAALSAAIEATRSEGGVSAATGASLGGPVPRPKRTSETIAQQIELLSTRYGPTHPEMKRLHAELAAAKIREQNEDDTPAPSSPAKTADPLSSDTAKAAKGDKGATRPRSDRIATISNDLQLAQARDRVNAIKTQLQFAEKEIEERKGDQAKILKESAVYQAKLQRLPVREQEMAQVTRDYEIAKANYKSLLDKRLSAGMATAMEHREKSERFEVIDPAQVPSKPTKPNRPALYASGSLVGLLFGVMLAVGLEFRKDLVLGEWEMPATVPVLGTVPLITAAPLLEHDQRPTMGRRRNFRLALFSAALSLLIALAAVAYLVVHRY